MQPKGLKSLLKARLNSRSVHKIKIIYTWTLLLTILVMGLVLPYRKPPEILPFSNYTLWTTMFLFAITYLTFILFPLVVAFLMELIASVFRQKFIMNQVIAICYLLWIVLTLTVLAGVLDIWLFRPDHHLHWLLSKFH